MGKRRADSAFKDNPVINWLSEWMDAPEGQQSIEVLDLVFDALEHAGVDARQRKIVWATGNGFPSSSPRSASTLGIRTWRAM